MAHSQRARSYEWSEGRDATGGDTDSDFDGGPDGEIGCSVEEVAFVFFET